VVEPAANADEDAVANEPAQCLVDRGPTGEIEKVLGSHHGAGASEAAVDAGGDEGLGGGHGKAKASEKIARFLTVHRRLAAASSRVEPERSDEKPDLRRYRTSSEE
jgi:hypothetical protein